VTGGSLTRTPQPVYCAIAHLHRDVGLARDVCRGTFRSAGATWNIADVSSWRDVDIAADRERWIDWSKFYYGLDLAFAYATTGDRIYAETWERLVRTWLERVPVECGPTDALGRRLQNWIYAWNMFADAPGFEGFANGFEDLLARAIADQADYLWAHLAPERNHRTIELYALLITALGLPRCDREAARLQFAWRALQDNLSSDFGADGVHREHSTHYHMIALRSFVAARENARRAGLDIPRSYDESLARACAFALACVRPDGSTPALSDGDVGSYAALLDHAADLLNLPELHPTATRGRRGGASASACADFRDGGYFVQRGAPADPAVLADERHLIFDCGPIGDGGHGHYDALSIDVWCGRHLIVDPGRFTYDPASDWRRWFKGTAAHNTVCVDDRDQTAYQPGKPKRPATTKLLTRFSTPLLDAVGGIVTSNEYDAVHRRHVLFIAGEYWIVIDELLAETVHDYDLRFHLAPETTDTTRIAGDSVDAPGLLLLLHGPGAVSVQSGWVAPEYGVKLPAPIVSKRAVRCDTATFVTAIVPRSAVNQHVSHRLTVARVSAVERQAVVEGAGTQGECVDRLTWSSDEDGGCRATLERRSR
jgi:Heparinase II/III-like protein/Heparinase II/III N-terminus